MRETHRRETRSRQRRLGAGVDPRVLEISRARMLGIESARHAFRGRSFELVPLALEGLDDSVECTAAAMVDHRLTVALQHRRLDHVPPDTEIHTCRREIEPVPRRRILRGPLPPPKRL